MVLRLFPSWDIIRTVLILHTVLTARIAHTRLTIQVVTKDSDSQGYCEL